MTQPSGAAASAATALPKKLHFAASRATRHADRLIDIADDYAGRTPPQRYASIEQALTASLEVPQYRRTYIQGCACATGIAGGGCCPGNAMGTAAQAGAGNTMALGAMVPVDAAVGAMGLYGMYAGATVARNAYDAMRQLGRVQADNAPALARARLWSAQVAPYDAMPRTREAAQAAVSAAAAEAADLATSIQEQKFNFAVPGLMQFVAAATATVGGACHLAGNCLGSIGGIAVGTCASGLFALYGGALAAKNLREYVLARRLQGIAQGTRITGDAAIDKRFAAAVAQHLESTRSNKLATGIAWAAVCAAGILGTLVSAGALAFSGALPVVLAVGLAAGAWAMWQNSRTRYVPHIPISPHVDRTHLRSSADRAITWEHLSHQDGAIKSAVAQMVALQRRPEVLKFHMQRLFRPQCGPKAFTVLAKSVQNVRGNAQVSAPEALSARYEAIQLEAARSFCKSERALLTARHQNQSEQLLLRALEIKGLTSPCCVPMTQAAEAALGLGAPTEPVYTRAARELEAEAFALTQAARRLVALDMLEQTLDQLADKAGKLATSSAQSWTDAQRDWAFARIQLLQLSGALSDAVSVKFIKQHPEFFTSLPAPQALPLNNVALLANQIANFTRAIAPELDGQFVHAFFNPRRIEGEIDFIIEREIKARNLPQDVQDSAAVAPTCESGTCCR